MKNLLIILLEFSIWVTVYAGTHSLPNVQKIYNQYNVQYFDDKLPKDAVVDWSETDDGYMATTVQMSDGRFHIAFNDYFSAADRTVRLLMLHEQCHVKTYGQSDDAHGRPWRTCMLELDRQGAFRDILIDEYERFK